MMFRRAQNESDLFVGDCLIDPWCLQEHWGHQLDIKYYAPADAERIRADRNDGQVIDDNASFADLLGFFSPSSDPENMSDTAYVAYTDGDYTARPNFTLMHEIGHYLQETDFDLMSRICSFEDDCVGKRFEEDACNRFASIALLPDKYIMDEILSDGYCADAISRIYEKGRSGQKKAKTSIRVSRIAVVRRIGALLRGRGYASLVKIPRKNQLGTPELSCRAWNDGTVDFSEELTEAETTLLLVAQSQEVSRYCANGRTFLGSDPSERPTRADIAFSYGRQNYAFIVVEYPDMVMKDGLYASMRSYPTQKDVLKWKQPQIPDDVLRSEERTMLAFRSWNTSTPTKWTGKPPAESTAHKQQTCLKNLGRTLVRIGCDDLAKVFSPTIFTYDSPKRFVPVYRRLMKEVASGSQMGRALERYREFLEESGTGKPPFIRHAVNAK